jgi:hypothetical protein
MKGIFKRDIHLLGLLNKNNCICRSLLIKPMDTLPPDKNALPDNLSGQSLDNLIVFARGVPVLLDKDLAKLYGIETKALNQAVKRNLQRFPEDFMFQLTKEECLRSQIVTSKGRGGSRYLPYAFTENGIAMLSSVLHSDIAIEVNIRIMRAFTKMRQLIANQAGVCALRCH